MKHTDKKLICTVQYNDPLNIGLGMTIVLGEDTFITSLYGVGRETHPIAMSLYSLPITLRYCT
jgi:hypothetical protein